MKYPNDFLNKIIQGDCLEILTLIPDNSIDLIVTDPPYGIEFKKGYKKQKETIFGDNGLMVMFFLNDILKEYKRVLKPNSAIYIFTRFDVMPYWWIKCKNFFFMKNCIIWFKGGIGMGDLEGNYGNNCEMIIYLTNGKHKLRGKREGNVWNYSKAKSKYHETQKPIDLIENIISHSSDEGMIVLDPFVGSGTTCIAAKQLNRNYIGIEISEEYCEIARQRLRQNTLL